MNYQAPTAAVQELLDRAAHLGGDEYLALNEACDLAFGAPGYRHLHLRPRDHAWWRLRRTLSQHQRIAALDELRCHLGAQFLPGHRVGHAIRDAAAAVLAHDLISQGPFTTSDHDVLLAPWRAATERCPRSRLALELMGRWPYPVDDLWLLIDAVLGSEPLSR